MYKQISYSAQAQFSDSITSGKLSQTDFSEYGWPDTLVSDNGPCYTPVVFTNLMQEYSINHITSSPHYPQSNELAEKFVQIVKNLFYKAKEEGTDLHKSLMIYHYTPPSNNLQSLMQMLQSRSTRSQLPMSNTARRQLGLSSQQLRIKTKNDHLPQIIAHNCPCKKGKMRTSYCIHVLFKCLLM